MKKREKTERVIFHHSLAQHSSVDQIRKWHKKRGFLDIGYHFVIRKDGTKENGRDSRLIGAHAVGRNSDSIGICFEGDFRKEEPTGKQINEAQRLYHSLCRYYCKNLEIDFHREGENACPGPMLDRNTLVALLESARPY